MDTIAHLLAHATVPPGPGDILKHDVLPAKGWSQREAARQLGLSKNRLAEICAGRRGVTAETAVVFALAFGTSPEFWLELQNKVDLWHAAQKMAKARRRKRAA
jgi:addiction module HigA family antidote